LGEWKRKAKIYLRSNVPKRTRLSESGRDNVVEDRDSESEELYKPGTLLISSDEQIVTTSAAQSDLRKKRFEKENQKKKNAGPSLKKNKQELQVEKLPVVQVVEAKEVVDDIEAV
jgi:hypothetical protein